MVKVEVMAWRWRESEADGMAIREAWMLEHAMTGMAWRWWKLKVMAWRWERRGVGSTQ